MRALLFRNKNYLMVSKMLRGLWDLRKNLLKLELEKMKGKENPRVQNTPNLVNDENPRVQNTPDSMYDESPCTQENTYPRVR